jgi:predicted flavoprotein YhiN
MMDTLTFETQAGDYTLHAQVMFCGQDVIVAVGGGTRPHVGAVGVAISHPGLKDASVHTTTPSVLTVPGHKETQIAQELRQNR